MPSSQDPDDYEGDQTFVARHLTPIEAHMLCGRLRAAGIPAETGDTNTVQAHSLLAPALGGASVRVPADYLAQARATIDALQRGDFALDDSFDPGESPA
ncbi:DUF2007 domain-containing protein [Roseateles amylovorans]|jgi:Putative prokaryotic signal transducing protein|uniref:DUF2007 domain-containing protein n=1 Tax=Roseateles amylovorans TaxID=2978473 RepID=A0ABY6AVL0_9BURK|nr:DUF2007 domain-containing protein [Roseateles amylovorans]UXH76348.1 DUF2007 domain-containing protein [Roseateles amylovorans]